MPDTPPSTPTTTGVTAGRTLAGRYSLERQLARGGMAEVWEATDEVLARQVAVKVLLPHLAADEVFVTRFRMEAVAAARLSHPNVVAVYDTFRENGTEGIVMELVRGATLRRLLDENGALSLSRAAAIGVAVADALEHAHKSGLVHRDVKPGNILLAENGRVVVTDFGIAKAAHETSDARHDLTDTGAVLGTVKYLSPEQVQGHAVDARSDVFSLGCVLYEMVCGRPPFSGGTAMATAMARINEQPLLPRQCRPGVPRALEDVILRSLSPDPDARYASAGELASALRSIDVAVDPDDATVAPPPSDATVTSRADTTPPRGVAVQPRFTQTERSWIVPAVLIVLIAVAVGVAGLLIGRTDVGRQIIEGARDAVTGQRDTSNPPPPVAQVRSFDPFGSGGEHDEDVANLVDGDLNTVWSTERYDTRDFGGLKPGVGVVLVLEGEGRLGRLEIATRSAGWAGEVYVAASPPPNLEGWGERVASSSGLGGSHAFDLKGREGAAVLLWITDLGDANRTEIAELTLKP